MSKYEVIIYWSEADKRYLAHAPELPGCIADGQNYLEAARNIEHVINDWLETAQMIGREIPPPKGKLLHA